MRIIKTVMEATDEDKTWARRTRVILFLKIKKIHQKDYLERKKN